MMLTRTVKRTFLMLILTLKTKKKPEDVCSIRVTSGTTDTLISDSFNVANKLCQFS